MNTHRFGFTIIRLVLIAGSMAAAWIPVEAQAGRIGINTTTPAAMLHVKDSSVLFSATTLNAGPPPVNGPGIRMMWYPQKAAFRAGRVTNLAWHQDSIGEASFASGFNTVASAKFSTAIGSIARATGENSLALGRLVNAQANSAIAIGLESTAFGVGSLSLGSYNTALESNGIAIGSGNTAYSMNATAIGLNNYAANMGAVTIGEGNFSVGINSLALGYFTSSDAYRQVTVGSWNQPSFTEDAENWIPTDPIFVIGNGENEGLTSNAVTVLKNGNVGIGVADPSATLEIDGTLRLGLNGTSIVELIKTEATYDLPSIAAGSSETVLFTVPNATAGSSVHISPQSELPDGLLMAYARVSASNTVEVKFFNMTGSAIDADGMEFYMTVIR